MEFLRKLGIQLHILEEPTEKTLEQLVVLPPPAETIFELTENDLENSGDALRRLFTYYATLLYIDKYRKNDGKWIPYDGNPLTFDDFDIKGISTHQIDWDARMKFDRDQLAIRLSRKPRIAFLPDRANPKYLRGVYISEGISEEHPWVPRIETVYIIKNLK